MWHVTNDRFLIVLGGCGGGWREGPGGGEGGVKTPREVKVSIEGGVDCIILN